jgi:hypothetical protein
MNVVRRNRFGDWLYNNGLMLVVLLGGIIGTFYVLDHRVSLLEQRVTAVELRMQTLEKDIAEFKSEVKAEMQILNFKLDILLNGKSGVEKVNLKNKQVGAL